MMEQVTYWVGLWAIVMTICFIFYGSGEEDIKKMMTGAKMTNGERSRIKLARIGKVVGVISGIMALLPFIFIILGWLMGLLQSLVMIGYNAF